MRWLLGIVLTILFVMTLGYIFIKGYPYRLYSNWMEGEGWNEYYRIESYRPIFLKPVKPDAIPPYKEDYSQLWKDFPLRNSNVPLPVRHPLFKTVPIVGFTGKKAIPQIGMILLAPEGRELSRVYTLPMRFHQDHSHGQELFKLPFIRNKLLKLPLDKLWKDIFSYKLEIKSKSLDKMIYDLYILHLRSKILPQETMKYGLIEEDKALVQLASRDKDYKIELIMTYDSGSIYSYVVKTEKNKDESQKLRSKFLQEISFSPVDKAMKKFLYTEFKQLNFARQVDQEGMLYLFSAWTQDVDDMKLLKEMIFFLERGRNNSEQLRPLYTYSMSRFGKTFTSRKIFLEHDDKRLLLQRNIELENIEKSQAADREKGILPIEAELSPDEKMNFYLKKAKEDGPATKDDMTIH